MIVSKRLFAADGESEGMTPRRASSCAIEGPVASALRISYFRATFVASALRRSVLWSSVAGSAP